MNSGILRLPLKAFDMLIKSPKLLFLAFLPGALTLALSILVCSWLWNLYLNDFSLWLSIPLMIIAFPISWLAFGNLSLIPFEDYIIDSVQKNLWKRVEFTAPPFSMRTLSKEILFSLSITVLFLLLLLLSFIPMLTFFSLFAGAWITAYGFLATFYTRLNANSLTSRLGLFFGNIVSNTLLGLFLNLLLFVPLLNVWLLGYALILASLVAIDQQNNK